MPDEKLTKTSKVMGRPTEATQEEKAAMFGVLSLYPRRSVEFRQKRAEFAVLHGVTTRTIDNWFNQLIEQFRGVA